MKLVDTQTAKPLILFTLPLGALGAIAARHVPVQMLRLGYGAAMCGLAWLLIRDEPRGKAPNGGAFIAGLISTGVGEATLPALVQRSRFPVPVANRFG